jgi:hypothetical protein
MEDGQPHRADAVRARLNEEGVGRRVGTIQHTMNWLHRNGFIEPAYAFRLTLAGKSALINQDDQE